MKIYCRSDRDAQSRPRKRCLRHGRYRLCRRLRGRVRSYKGSVCCATARRLDDGRPPTDSPDELLPGNHTESVEGLWLPQFNWNLAVLSLKARLPLLKVSAA